MYLIEIVIRKLYEMGDILIFSIRFCFVFVLISLVLHMGTHGSPYVNYDWRMACRELPVRVFRDHRKGKISPKNGGCNCLRLKKASKTAILHTHTKMPNSYENRILFWSCIEWTDIIEISNCLLPYMNTQCTKFI